MKKKFLFAALLAGIFDFCISSFFSLERHTFSYILLIFDVPNWIIFVSFATMGIISFIFKGGLLPSLMIICNFLICLSFKEYVNRGKFSVGFSRLFVLLSFLKVIFLYYVVFIHEFREMLHSHSTFLGEMKYDWLFALKSILFKKGESLKMIFSISEYVCYLISLPFFDIFTSIFLHNFVNHNVWRDILIVKLTKDMRILVLISIAFSSICLWQDYSILTGISFGCLLATSAPFALIGKTFVFSRIREMLVFVIFFVLLEKFYESIGYSLVFIGFAMLGFIISFGNPVKND